MDLTSRLLNLIIVTTIGCAVYLIWKRSLMNGTNKLINHFNGYEPGKPGIVLFTTPQCAPCKTIHRPMIRRILNRLDSGLQYIEVDATEYPELAAEWGVVSVPTTYLLEDNGRSKYVHFGLVNENTLTKQIQELL